ncbi:ATP-binding cassette domain-containing protein [Cohnella candidum]|uniref:ATP-binding cassette domain-containing protein n=1 Tax=Cohnella candidum TaxID=2674991 RepID=A0A3G3K312_9BACL|nr:ATP-binding cassette domain-containing protein [Cohnella candidum]AYQ74447.1 ATP-binding cassette domain-containing protein [Cohnella candidum]
MIRVNNVSYSYVESDEIEGVRPALQGVTLEVAEGSYVALMGSNGSGKSTLARMLNGLLQPESGTVTVDGMDAAEPAIQQQLRRSVQFVFQNPENQIVGVTVEDDIAFGLSNLKVPRDEMRKRITWALETVGLQGREREATMDLSGGEKQKLALASVLVMLPRYLVMDEPTSMLDPGARAHFLDMLIDIHRQQGIGLLHITHDYEEIRRADRVVLFREGRVMGQGTPLASLETPELLASCGIELPYLAAVSAALRQRGVRLPVWPTEEEVIRALC